MDPDEASYYFVADMANVVDEEMSTIFWKRMEYEEGVKCLLENPLLDSSDTMKLQNDLAHVIHEVKKHEISVLIRKREISPSTLSEFDDNWLSLQLEDTWMKESDITVLLHGKGCDPGDDSAGNAVLGDAQYIACHVGPGLATAGVNALPGTGAADCVVNNPSIGDLGSDTCDDNGVLFQASDRVLRTADTGHGHAVLLGGLAAADNALHQAKHENLVLASAGHAGNTSDSDVRDSSCLVIPNQDLYQDYDSGGCVASWGDIYLASGEYADRQELCQVGGGPGAVWHDLYKASVGYEHSSQYLYLHSELVGSTGQGLYQASGGEYCHDHGSSSQGDFYYAGQYGG